MFLKFGIPMVALVGIGLMIPILPIRNHYMEYGKCIVDYSEALSDWLERKVDKIFREGNRLEHHDIYQKEYKHGPGAGLGSAIWIEHKGFFATRDDHARWVFSMHWWDMDRRHAFLAMG